MVWDVCLCQTATDQRKADGERRGEASQGCFFFFFEICFFFIFFKCLAGDTLTQCTTFFTVHLRIIVMIKINPRATLKQLVHGSANTIIIYYLHLKIYLLSSWVRNIAVIPLDIHVICKYAFLCTSLLKKRTTHLFLGFLGIFLRESETEVDRCISRGLWEVLHVLQYTKKRFTIKWHISCVFFFFFSPWTSEQKTLGL